MQGGVKCMNVSVFGVASLVLVMSGSAWAQPAAADTAATAPVNPAWTHFSASVSDYIKLRTRIGQELPPLTVTTKPAEIAAASDAIAQAVQRAQPKAQQGRFF